MRMKGVPRPLVKQQQGQLGDLTLDLLASVGQVVSRRSVLARSGGRRHLAAGGGGVHCGGTVSVEAAVPGQQVSSFHNKGRCPEVPR